MLDVELAEAAHVGLLGILDVCQLNFSDSGANINARVSQNKFFYDNVLVFFEVYLYHGAVVPQ